MSYSNLILQEQTDEKKKKRRDLYRLGAAALAGGALTGGIVAKKTLTPKNLIKHYQDTALNVAKKIQADPSIAGTPYDYKKVENMTKRGIAARAAVKPLQGALIGGGAALGLDGALGGALGTVGAYQLAKMARPKKKKPKKLVQYYR